MADEHSMLRPGLGRLKGKVAIITGANSGIGRATARLFSREDAKVVCCDIQETITPRIDELITQDGGEAVFTKIDVTKQEDCDRMVTAALEKFGDVDILYNNAGAGIRKKLHEHTDEEWNFVLNVNLNAMFRGARSVLPHFIKQRSGNIVTTASTFGLLASAEYPGYCATKAAIVNLTREMALDYGQYGVRVNCVCPGAIDTPASVDFPRVEPSTKTRQRSSAPGWRAATRHYCGWALPKKSLTGCCFSFPTKLLSSPAMPSSST